MDLGPFKKVVLGSVAFAIFWILAVFPAVPFLPIGRTAGSILGATLMVIFEVITPKEAYSAINLNLPVLGLLFGTMVVSIYLERADMFKHLGVLLSWKSWGAKDMLCRICVVSAISSALFTNDTACVFLTEFILKIARQNNIRPEPFLLGLASSSNIGSSATPIGNPQNLIIAIQSDIFFGEFVLGLLPAVLVGVFVNALILICMFWRLLSDVKEEEDDALYEMIVMEEEDALDELIVKEDSAVHQISLATMSSPKSLESHEYDPIAEHVNSQRLCELDMCSDSSGEIELKKSVLSKKEATDNIGEQMEERFARGGVQGTTEKMTDLESGPQQSTEESKGQLNRWKRLSWKLCIYLGTVGMLVAFLMGLDMSWTALTAALIFVILDFKDAGPCLEKVSYSLLVFFCGMFITVEGFNKTEIPSSLWSLMEPHARIDHASGIAVLAIVILVLSNVASNVPTVLLLGAKVAASTTAISPSKDKKAWLILAWVSTVAGNL
ncbi:silicon efflux transporter LSI2-like isoform X2 [Populus nigra]|uniref:silicon efflux transporter LSI2-like isoform X2 n=1 Tax=Populus nigra TaxID=3691 RepID=UPI002B2750A3|nr:silicon efflux transporter LSI2-like isoform X2 [Populus nigra]